MKKLTNICIIMIIMAVFHTTGAVANDNVLLPQPQQIRWTGGKFRWQQVRIVSPVMEQRWLEFANEAGLEASAGAKATIEVEMVDNIPEAAEAQNEASNLCAVPEVLSSISGSTEKTIFYYKIC